MQGSCSVITKIVERLKTGSIKRVVPYGVKILPEPPYVVVKPEKDPVGRGRLFRVIAHFFPGQNIMLEDYVFNEVFNLLDNFASINRHNSYNKLSTENNYIDTIVDNDDGTISMEREFLLPFIIS
jgi:hypothetical protein